MDMPRRHPIIGLLFCLVGLLALVDAVTDLIHGRINLNFTIFLLPVGIGLLRGKERSRWWAKVFIIAGGYFPLGLMMSVVLLNPGSAHVHWPGGELQGKGAIPWLLTIALLLGVCLRVVYKALDSEKVSTSMHNRINAIS